MVVERGILSGLGMGGVVLLSGLLYFSLSSGVQNKTLDKRERIVPNQGIWRSACKGLYFCLLTGAFAFICAWLIISSVAGMAMGWLCALTAGFLCGIVKGWFSDWRACMRHLGLRVLLWRAGSIPRNYIRFLDYAVERIFLRKTGGGYIFIHRQLLEYFARLTLPEIGIERIEKVKPDTKDATIYHNRGRIFAEFSEYQQAIRNYTRAIELDPKEVSFYRDRGVAYAKCKEYQQAIADYTSVIDLDPKNAWAYRERGIANRRLKEYEKAITDFTQAIRLEPERALTYRYRGWSYQSNKEYEKALVDFSHAIKLAPQEARCYEDRGQVYMNLEEYEKAIADLSTAVELIPQEAQFYDDRGHAYAKLKEYEKAIADFTQAINLEPERVLTYRYRGWSYQSNKEYEKALVDFTRVIELAPQSVWLYQDRGSTYIQLEEYEKAIADFNRSVELEPSNASLYSRRGSAFLQMKAYEQTIGDCTRAIELDATYESAYFHRGYAYLWLKESKLAHADFVQCAALTPKSTKAAWMVIYSDLGKQRPSSEIIEALESATGLDKIVAIEPRSGAVRFCQGVTLGFGNNYRDGIEELEQSIQLGKFVQDAYFWKGLFCAYLGQEAEATQAIVQALEAGLPPVLLTPLYWLEQERPEMYQTVAVPLLVHYDI